MTRTDEPHVNVPKSARRLLQQKHLKIPAPTAEILPLQKKLKPLIQRAWPDGSDKDISWFVADLAGLWEVSRVHIILVRKLLKMADELEREKLQQLSQELDVNWFSNATGHLDTMKKDLARFKASIYGYSRKRPKRKTKGD